MTPRPYQIDCVESVLLGFNEFQRQLIVVPTGGGKSCCFAWLAERTKGRTLILAHREELIDQAIDKIRRSTGIAAEKEKAEFSASKQARVVVASIQTMGRRLDEWPADHFELVVCDEAHHAISASWRTVLDHFGTAKVLGVTATPDRGDKKNLGAYFENLAYEVSIFDLIKQGYLSPIKVKSLPLEIDLKGIKTVAGDYSAQDLGDRLAPYLRGIARQIRDNTDFRKTLVFLPLIATSETFTAICKEEGLSAAHIDGNSEDRKEILARFSAGEFDVLNNAMLLTEGYDEPTVDCVAILRPTKSRPLFCQMVGRGTRIAPGKSDLLLLDFLWLHEKHNLIRPAHLVAGSDEIADAMQRKLDDSAKAGGGQEEFDLEGLQSEAVAEREEKLRAELALKAKKAKREIDAMEFCLSVGAHAAADYTPTTQGESMPVTDGQAGLLENYKIDLDSVTCRGHASKIIEAIISRSKLNLATPKQVRLLKQLKHPKPESATFDEASAYLDARLSRGKRKAPQFTGF